ncbi:MAG TPA: type II toxin-antitoxin system VapC family toxin [Acidimicrobiales bacterium]|nr:type II toxin-antitoxin system VapC family toxin [Acidimicrobiales bacterium]
MTTAYFDTSAIIPLIVEELGSNEAKELWREADRVVSARIVYAEGHAALALAVRTGRLRAGELKGALRELVGHYEELYLVEISDLLVRRAGALAEQYSLRGDDSIHLAAAEMSQDETPLVFVAGDVGLCEAAGRIGLDVVRMAGGWPNSRL